MSPHIYVYPIAGIISSSFRGLPFPSLLPRAGNQSSLSEQHRVALDLVPHQKNSRCEDERNCNHPEVGITMLDSREVLKVHSKVTLASVSTQ
jgi:hypothetical protein